MIDQDIKTPSEILLSRCAMKRLVLLLSMLLLITATATQGGQGASERVEFPFWVEWDLYNACANEVLHGSGTVYITTNTITRPDGSQRMIFYLRVGDDWRLVGNTSGDVWVFVPGINHTEVVEPADYSGFIALAERFTVVNESTGVVMKWPSKIHVVFNAQGELVVDRWVGDACTLIHD